MDSMLILYCVVCVMVTHVYGNLKDNDVKNVASKFNKGDFTNENSVEHNTQQLYEPAPCQIVQTRYGCCWDRKTIARGPNGEGCPVCKDHRHMKCKSWKPFCKDRIVSEMCPSTCGKCPIITNKGCTDDAMWKKLCPTYKQLNFCKQKTIARHCKLTCGKCT